MKYPTCRTVDPVELLLRRIFRRAVLLAGVSSLAACAQSHVELTSADAEDDAGHSGPAGLDGSAELDAGDSTRLDAAGPDAFRLDAAGRDAAPSDATGPMSGDALGPAGTCQDGGYPLAVHAARLTPAETFDYLALRLRTGLYETPEGGGDWTGTESTLLSETGTACATANAGACAQQLARHPQPYVRPTCFHNCDEISVVTTRDDEVRRWTTEAELKLLLGAIDSADDALLLVNAARYTVSCADAASMSKSEGGYELYATRTGMGCQGIVITRHHLLVSTRGEILELDWAVVAGTTGCAGRKPVGLRSQSRDRGRSRLGDFLAHCAHLEAASVVSFERLARELRAHGAPQALIDGALAARADEVRHAQIVGRLAEARGGEPSAPEVDSLPVRQLEEIALENATEGCVRETFGALVGSYQAEHAADAELRSAMVELAADEARHAALAQNVHRWLLTQLGPEARERVLHARQRAIFELAAEISAPSDPELEEHAGLPPRRFAQFALRELARTLWAPGIEQLARPRGLRA